MTAFRNQKHILCQNNYYSNNHAVNFLTAHAQQIRNAILIYFGAICFLYHHSVSSLVTRDSVNEPNQA